MNLPIQSQPVTRQRTAISTQAYGVNPSVCVGGSVRGNQICVKVPVLGTKCVTLPFRPPVGATVRGCTCSKFGIPCGVRITASVAGRTIFSKGFGCC